MKRIVKYLLIIFTFFICFNVYAEEIEGVLSKNIIMYNLNDDEVIYEKNSNDKVNIASLTKIMTAIVSIENIDDYNKSVLITSDMLKDVTNDLSVAGFKVGDVVTYNDLLYGTLLKSGADATNILAISISGSINNFVSLMNNKAKNLGMYNTSFSNTIGIESEKHYSTAKDVAILLKYAFKNKKFREVFETEHYENGKYIMDGPLKRINTDENNYVVGAKTGYTSKAGLCLASIAKYNNIGYLLVTIGAPKDDPMQNIKDSKKIYEYFFKNYSYKEILNKNDTVVKVKTVYGKEYDIKSFDDVTMYLKNDITKDDLIYKYDGDTLLKKGVKQDDKIGTYYILYNNEILYKTNVYAPKDVKFDLLFFIKENIVQLTLILIIIILVISIIRIRKK